MANDNSSPTDKSCWVIYPAWVLRALGLLLPDGEDSLNIIILAPKICGVELFTIQCNTCKITVSTIMHISYYKKYI